MTAALPPVRGPKPCAECPWRRASLPGWLGPHTAEEWDSMAHGESWIACHLSLPAGADDMTDAELREHPGVRQCAGSAIFRSNVCKLPRDPQIATLPADKATVFGYGEFVPHHKLRRTTREAQPERWPSDEWWDQLDQHEGSDR